MISTTEWIVTIAGLAIFISLDLIAAIMRRNKKTTIGEAAFWTIVYVGTAILFGALLPQWGDKVMQKEYFAGWLTEYALSVDNIFVFIIILGTLKIEKEKQHLVLLLGILLTIGIRGLMIPAGATLISKFGWIFFFFGAFLIYTAWSLAKESEDDEWEEGRMVRFLESKGVSAFTIALVALGLTNLVFSLDSIPAIFGLTKNAYVVTTANVFALMGLRQLYFLLEELLERLIYLSKGLSVILGFIGIKMIFEAFHEVGVHEIAGIHLPTVSIEASLLTIIGILAVTAITSIAATRNKEAA